jgi:hypothetical protein
MNFDNLDLIASIFSLPFLFVTFLRFVVLKSYKLKKLWYSFSSFLAYSNLFEIALLLLLLLLLLFIIIIITIIDFFYFFI